MSIKLEQDQPLHLVPCGAKWIPLNIIYLELTLVDLVSSILDIWSNLMDLAIFYELFLSGKKRWEQDEPHHSLNWVLLRSTIWRWSGRGDPQVRQSTPFLSSGTVSRDRYQFDSAVSIHMR